jgi:hypothetical protein
MLERQIQGMHMLPVLYLFDRHCTTVLMPITDPRAVQPSCVTIYPNHGLCVGTGGGPKADGAISR